MAVSAKIRLKEKNLLRTKPAIIEPTQLTYEAEISRKQKPKSATETSANERKGKLGKQRNNSQRQKRPL